MCVCAVWGGDVFNLTSIPLPFSALIVMNAYLTFLGIAQPYERKTDQLLAFLSSCLLCCCFVFGLMLKLCEEGETCDDYFGLASPEAVSILVVGVGLGILAVVLGVIILLGTVVLSSHQAVRLTSTGFEPSLQLTAGCSFHAFISHAWKTAQDQTHALVRSLQLLVPGILIWLDVDQLEDVGKLDEAVEMSMAFIIFLSKGYFTCAASCVP